MSRWLGLYQRLPYPFRVATASAWGAYLRSRRYGRKTERLIADAQERETWSLERWRVWREERLARILHRSVTRVPYYRDQWERRRRQGDRSSWELLENWPILEKEEVRRQPGAFLADDCDPRRMIREHTSGTTGTPLSLWWSRETAILWYALCELRIRHWNGVTRHCRWANLGGQLVTAFDQKSPPFWVWNAGMRQLYLSSYHLSDRNIGAYIEALERHRISYLLGYPSSIHTIARFVRERALRAPPLRVIVTNAEPLYPGQRDTIERAFDCPVRNTYGMSELVAGASECREGNVHSWPEVGEVEVLDDQGAGLPPGEPGRFVCTGLLNPDMPLIRYAVGDRGVFLPGEKGCSCGRTLPRLGEIDGRDDDAIITAEGRRVGRLDPVFKADLPVREAQVVQLDRTRIQVRLVPGEGFSRGHENVITHALRDRLGAMEVEVRRVDEIPRSANGKFRAVVGLGQDAG